MHSFLIVGGNKIKIEKQIGQKTKLLGAKRLDFSLSKIADVRDLTKITSLTFSQATAIILKDFDLATEEAQNAFLKTLEEPQENLYFILSALTKDSVLPTISSRCQVVEVVEKENTPPETISLSENFINFSLGEKMKLTDQIKDREKAGEFLDQLLAGSRELLLKNPLSKNYLNFIEELINTKAKIKANGNISLQLTTLVVNSVF